MVMFESRCLRLRPKMCSVIRVLSWRFRTNWNGKVRAPGTIRSMCVYYVNLRWLAALCREELVDVEALEKAVQSHKAELEKANIEHQNEGSAACLYA